MSDQAQEVNFDSIIGPTHNYSGLSFGNKASMQHELTESNPKEAALEGLAKMHALMKMGLKQGVLPPHERPFMPILHALGYRGSEEDILLRVWREMPALLLASSSAASMWAANAATVSPSADSLDGHVHFTPANLISKFHRSFESPFTGLMLKKIFADPAHFVHHPPLPPDEHFADEGAANHTRFCQDYGKPGIQLFVFGRSAFKKAVASPSFFPARQTLEASQAVSRLHQLLPAQTIFAQQNPEAIDGGVFHNDVISVGNQTIFLYHEKAFLDTPQLIETLKNRTKMYCQTDLKCYQVLNSQISLEEAVRTYFFNSQLVSMPRGMVLIAPIECKTSETVKAYLDELLQHPDQLIKEVSYQKVIQSMKNGGGPACLRLRVVLTHEELAHISPHVLLTEQLYQTLVSWVKKHYRDRLRPSDLSDGHLLLEVRRCLSELTDILQLGPLYSFQV